MPFKLQADDYDVLPYPTQEYDLLEWPPSMDATELPDVEPTDGAAESNGDDGPCESHLEPADGVAEPDGYCYQDWF